MIALRSASGRGAHVQRYVIALAAVCACALFLRSVATSAPARAEDDDLGTQIEAVEAQAQADPTAAADSLQTILDDVSGAWANTISDFLGSLQAADAEFWATWGTLLVTGLLMLVGGILCALGDWLCPL